jgi:hypothetical protein
MLPQQFYEKFFSEGNIASTKGSFPFLFGGEGTDYYNWKVYCEKNNISEVECSRLSLVVLYSLFICDYFMLHFKIIKNLKL